MTKSLYKTDDSFQKATIRCQMTACFIRGQLSFDVIYFNIVHECKISLQIN